MKRLQSNISLLTPCIFSGSLWNYISLCITSNTLQLQNYWDAKGLAKNQQQSFQCKGWSGRLLCGGVAITAAVQYSQYFQVLCKFVFWSSFSIMHWVWKYKLFWLHSHLYNYLNASEGSCVVFSYCFCNIPTFYLKIAFHIFLGWHKRFFRSLLSNMQYLPDFISCKHDNNRFLEHTENKKLPASAKVRQELVLPLCLVDFRRRNGPQTWNS